MVEKIGSFIGTIIGTGGLALLTFLFNDYLNLNWFVSLFLASAIIVLTGVAVFKIIGAFSHNDISDEEKFVRQAILDELKREEEPKK